MKETTITFCDSNENALVVTADHRFLCRIECARQKYPDKVEVLGEYNGNPMFSLPFAWLDIRPPLRLSAAERQRRGIRLAEINKRKRNA